MAEMYKQYYVIYTISKVDMIRYILVECEDLDDSTKDQKVKEMYRGVMKRFIQALFKGGQDCRLRRATIARQQQFIEKLVKLVKLVTRESGNRKRKVKSYCMIERLQALLQDVEVCKINFSDFDALPLPLNPEIQVVGIIPEKASLFKSALMPCRLVFRTEDGPEYVTMFKHGDDLRQDQLVLQIITLMDKLTPCALFCVDSKTVQQSLRKQELLIYLHLLRRENLDLKLTPYKHLLAIGPLDHNIFLLNWCYRDKNSMIQIIDSVNVADVLNEHDTIQNYLKKQAPDKQGPYGISAEVMDNYVKSCAGYCVVTYLLGIGDRHLDNLLLTKNGKLFHIDFGFILGRDPKPLPPPMKLSKEMVEAMGGTNSEHFHDFKKHCYTAFLALRRSANLIINLFSLMVDANIPDIALEPDKTVKKVQDKFVLHLTDEEAVHYLQNLIDVSVSAMMAALVEQFHKMAQYFFTIRLLPFFKIIGEDDIWLLLIFAFFPNTGQSATFVRQVYTGAIDCKLIYAYMLTITITICNALTCAGRETNARSII
ncbi:hypothetical protein KUTeg_018476 [Tegillarca granosa]|uniref:PI3K/PI4K catalytic domain-containing protein n=1 Tax=Tegillarca granosa TaxID=220873 RepID=A0ABQ9EHZ4_TEGGR|nr:hypothetical protein KUTeg_018476 [Tegillarca granosa]